VAIGPERPVFCSKNEAIASVLPSTTTLCPPSSRLTTVPDIVSGAPPATSVWLPKTYSVIPSIAMAHPEEATLYVVPEMKTADAPGVMRCVPTISYAFPLEPVDTDKPNAAEA
jgi:hypothetical protein